jgi:pimeloyl-ACP methyl ester carboxylesterase
MPRSAIGNLSVHYQQVGAGPDLVLIHGLFCNLAFWYLTVAPILAEAFRVTVYDLRGHGLTQRVPAGYRAVDLAEDLRRLMDHLGIDSAHLVGHSFGGAVALAFAVGNPVRTRSLTLADAWIPTLQPWPGRLRRWAALQERLMESGIRADRQTPKVLHGFLEELVRLNEIEGAASNPTTLAIESLIAGNGNPLSLRRWRQLVGTTTAATEFLAGNGIAPEQISTLRRPASLMFGKRSRYLPSMRGLRRCLYDCRVTLVPDAGHYFPILKAGFFAHSVKKFAWEHERQ